MLLNISFWVSLKKDNNLEFELKFEFEFEDKMCIILTELLIFHIVSYPGDGWWEICQHPAANWQPEHLKIVAINALIS